MPKKFLPIIFILVFSTWLIAGVTGKIAGTVIDAKTHEPLAGVNVVIEGTYLGASSDGDGYFVILNIPPGSYKLQAMYVGYQTVQITDVQVSVDITTKIDIMMHETTLETSDEITVVAKRPIIRKDAVATRHFVNSDQIEIQPVNSFQQIAQNQAGVVGSHFRGGRPGEVLVMIDGVAVRDPAGAYAGNMGGFTGDVPEYAIEEMEVTLGGFSAEYGNVQSGILNLALKEGTPKIRGRLRFTNTPKFGSSESFTENNYTFHRFQPQENIYEVNLSGPLIFKKLGFSASAEVTDRKQGLYLNENSFDQAYQGKLSYRFTPQHKLTIGGIFNRSDWDNFYFPASRYGPGKGYVTDTYIKGLDPSKDTLMVYKYVDDKSLYGTIKTDDTPNSVTAQGDTFNVTKTFYMAGMEDYLWNNHKETNLAYLNWTHSLSSRTYYEIRLSTFLSNYHYAPVDVDDRDHDGNRSEDLQWDLSKPGPHPIYREREQNYWWVRGDDPGYLDERSWTHSLKFDMVSQVTRNHLIKGGLQAHLNRSDVQNISWTLGVGTFRKDIWKQNYFDLGAYVQDKLEFQGIIALVGLRFDMFDPNGFGSPVYYPGDYGAPYSQIGPDGRPVFLNPKKAKATYQLSPRIGISHPITERSVLHFTYGHYFQRPDGYYLFRNHYIQSLTKVGNFIGNPSLAPEKTVAYELGIEQQFFSDIRFTVTGYYKDVTNLLNWRKYVGRTIQNFELNVYTNADYGNIKGLEFTLEKRIGKFFGGNINYTFSIAKGRSSNATGGSGSFTSVKRMNLLNFDQTHTVNANILLRTPQDFGPQLAGVHPLGGFKASILFKYGSGLPYSSYGTRKINDERMPWTSTTDIKLLRSFTLSRYKLNLFMDIFNLFDKKNIRFIGNSLYYDSGDPNDPSIKGDPSVVRRDVAQNYYRNPQAYSAGRQIRFGLGLNF